VDESDLRVHQISMNKPIETDNATQGFTGTNVNNSNNMLELATSSSLLKSYSLDDLSLLPLCATRIESKQTPVSSSMSVSAVHHSTPRRRWSFDSSPLPLSLLFHLPPTPTPSAPAVAVAASSSPSATEEEVSQQIVRSERFATEDIHLFAPLAARCSLPSCRKLTLYRCHRCNLSFSCSLACQKKVSWSVSSERMKW
jgi:hypothetical protein